MCVLDHSNESDAAIISSNTDKRRRLRRWSMAFLPWRMHASTASSFVLEKKAGTGDIFLDVTPEAVT